jgi:hypothetical protein
VNVLAAGVVIMASAPASAVNNCMQDITTAGGGGTLNCNSNDVRIAKVTNISAVSGITGTGTPSDPFKCFSGGAIEFTADFEVDLGAQARYDIGLYIAQNQMQALTGTCNTGVITKANAPLTFINSDAAPDSCGDITGNLGTAFNPQIVHLDIKTTCTAAANTTKLALPNCTSWRQPGSNTTCTSINDAFPGSPSKCNCDNNFTIDVNVEAGKIEVTKTASPTQVNEGPTGGLVTYTVQVHNPLVATSVDLTSLTEDDDNSGTVDFTYNSTSSPTLASICDRTHLDPCGADANACAATSTATCTFTRTVSGLEAGGSKTDKVCASGTDSNQGPVGPTCATASVSAKDVQPTATLTKTVDSLVCATVKYKVQIDNTDLVESLTLTALTDDKAGGNLDITTVHDNVLATNCGLGGSGNPGTLPATIAVGGMYACKYDVKVCATGQTTNTATATLHDNENNAITPSGSAKVTINVTTP